MSTVEVIFLTAAVLTFSAGLIIVALNPWRMINRSYLVAASLSAAWLFCVFVAVHIGKRQYYDGRSQDSLFWLRIGNGVASFLPCSFFLINASIVGSYPFKRLNYRPWLWVLASCLLAFLSVSESFIPSDSTPEAQLRGIGYPVYMASFFALCIMIIYDAANEMRQCNGIQRLEIKFFVINICLGTIATLLTFSLGAALKIPVLRYAGPFIVVAYFGLTIWALCSHRIFDARQVFAALGRHLSTLTVLIASIHIADSLLTDLILEPYDLTISACCGGVLAAFWDRKVFRWLNLDPKLLLAGPRAQIIEWARQEADAGKLVARFEGFLRDWCQTDFVSVHTLESREPPGLILDSSDYPNTFPRLCETGYMTPETLDRRRPDSELAYGRELMAKRNLSALIAVPRGSHSPSCVVAFGPKQSLRPYTYPDIQLLIELVELMNNILSQAQVATRAAQIVKMEAAAMMSQGLAHDLNNLATPVSSFLLHMEKSVAADTPEAEVLNDAKHSITVMQDYIRESLFFSRRLVPVFQNVSGNEILDTILKVTQGRAQARGVSVVTNYSTTMDFVADRAMLMRLMQNLVHNGIDATPRGGMVTLSAGSTEYGRVCFSVTDQGPGVPNELQERIFEPYFTTKDTGSDVRGLGLGLAISLKISGLHDGDLSVSKASDGGATFTFTMPVIPARPNSIPDQLIYYAHPNRTRSQP